MFNKRIIISTLAVYATTMFYGFVVFGTLLHDFYIANMGDMVVRPKGEELMEWLALAELFIAYAFVWVWSQSGSGTHTSNGLKFGFFMGMFWGAYELLNYAFVPLNLNVALSGFALDIVMFMLAGAVLSKVWAKLTPVDSSQDA